MNISELEYKFINDYFEALKDGFQVQVKTILYGWVDLKYNVDVKICYTFNIFVETQREYYLETPLGKFYKSTIRINFPERDTILY